jgi:hypothetical protein
VFANAAAERLICVPSDRMGVAGGSARDQADRARAAANVLERKAAYAARRAEQFDRGSAGESAVAVELATLTADGYLVLHDRVLPDGGNIDHLLIGPFGVYVIDAKAWTGPVTVDSGGVLRCNGRRRTDAVTGVERQVATVRDALQRAGHGDVQIRGLLAIATPDAGQQVVRAGDVSVVPLGHLASGLRGRTAPTSQSAAEAMWRALSEAFRPADAAPDLPEGLAADERQTLFDRGTRVLFVDLWSKAGKRRLYLKDSSGTALGWKDVVAGTIAVTHAPDDALVRGVLANATTSGLNIDGRLLPKIPVAIPGGRLMVLAGLRTVFLIGQRWRRGGQDRLYGTWASTNEGVVEIGHADLLTGQLHPSSDQPVAKDRSTPEQLLTNLLKRRPPA